MINKLTGEQLKAAATAATNNVSHYDLQVAHAVQDAIFAANPESEWRPVGEGVTYPCCMITPQGNRFFVNDPSDNKIIQAIGTHFIPCTLPEPPPEMSAMELAWTKAYPQGTWVEDSLLCTAFKAGYIAAQQSGGKSNE